MIAATMTPEVLAAHLEDRLIISHARYRRGYGPLTGKLRGTGPRTVPARVRLLTERHLKLAVQDLDSSYLIELDYPDDIGDDWSPDARPTGVIFSRPGCDTLVALTWTEGTLRFEASPLDPEGTTVALGASDAGERLTAVLTRLCAEAFAGGSA